MGQQNIMFTGPMLDMEPQQARHHLEPCMVSYNGVTCFPQPYNNHTILPPSFDLRYLPENHGQLPYMIAQYNGEHCNAFMIPSSSGGVFSVPVNHHQMFERNRGLLMDGPNAAFKSHLVHGGQPVQTVPTPWFDQNCATGSFLWNHAHGVPYLQGYQVATISRNSTIFVHPPPPPMRSHQGPHNVYHPPAPAPPPPPPPPLLPVQAAQNVDIHLQLPSTSHRQSTSTSTTYPFLNSVDLGPRFVGAIPPVALRVYEAHRRELMIDSTARHRSFPHLRVLPEDGVAILDISNYSEVAPLVDRNINMHLDIDHMSYEELLALGEQIGNVDSGLSDNFISDHLKTRTFASPRPSHSQDPVPPPDEPNFCVICQMEFEDQEDVGMLNCRHEYHAECIKKWLVVKNNCPICKSTALT